MSEKNEGLSCRSNSSDDNEGNCNRNGMMVINDIRPFEVRLNQIDQCNSQEGRDELIREINEIEKKKSRRCNNYLESNLELEVKRIEVYKPVLITKNRLMVINTQALTEALRPNNMTENSKQRSIQFINKVIPIIQRKRLRQYFSILKSHAIKGECKVMISELKRLQSAKSITTNKITDCCLINNTKKRYLKHHYYSKCFNTILQYIILIQNTWRKRLSSIRSKIILNQMRSKYPLQLKTVKKKTILNQSSKNIGSLLIKRIKPYTITKVSYHTKSIIDNPIENSIQLKSQLKTSSYKNQSQRVIIKLNQISISYITKTRIVRYKSSTGLINTNQQITKAYSFKLTSLSRILLQTYWTNMINKLKTHCSSMSQIISVNSIINKHTEEETIQFIFSLHKILSKNMQEKIFNYLNQGHMISQSFYFTTLKNHLQLINDYSITSLIDNAFEVRIALSHYFTQTNTLKVYSLHYNDKVKEQIIEDNLLKDIYSIKDIKKLIAYMNSYISKYYLKMAPINTILISKIKEYFNHYKAINTSIFGISRLIQNFIRSIDEEDKLMPQIRMNKGNITIMLNHTKANNGVNNTVLLYNNKSIFNYYTVNAYEKRIDLDTKQKQFLQLYIEGSNNEVSPYITNNNKYHYYSNLKMNALNKWEDNKAMP